MRHRPLSVLGTVLALVLSMLTVLSPAASADVAGKGGDFVPLEPSPRVLDTRNNIGANGPRGPGSTTAFQVRGVGSVPNTDVRAVLVGVTPVGPTAGTYLTLWPTGVDRPVTSNVNINANSAPVSNTAIVQLGSDGKMNVYNYAGNVHVLVDIRGYFTDTPSTTAGRGGFIPMPHTALFDTRNGTGVPKATIPAKGTLTVTVPTTLVPTGANAVFLDLIVPAATTGSWLGANPPGAPVQSVMSFATGTTASGLTVRMSADNKISFLNNAGSAINLVATLQGYFSANPAQGAGLRMNKARLLHNYQLGANATVDVAVGGIAGTSTRGIAGAAINFTAAGPASTGYLRAWPLGAPEPGTSLANYANSTRADMAIVRPGAEGRIRIRNVSSGDIRLFVDLQGWFADPIAPVAIEQYAPTIAMQTTPPQGQPTGTIEYSYVDNIGRLFHGHQADVNNFSTVQWTPMPGNEAFTGRPAMIQGPDGKLRTYARNTSTDIWSATQTDVTTPAIWGPWSNFGGSFVSSPTVAALPDKTPVAFVVDADGVLWHRKDADWRNLGDANLTGTPSAVTVRDGIQVFALGAGGGLRTALYTTAGSLTAWTDLGGSGLAAAPAVVVYPGFRLRLFVRAANGTIQTKLQNIGGDYPAAWDPIAGLTATGSPAAVLSPAGIAEIVVRGADSEVYNTGETAQGSGTWRAWDRIYKDGQGNPLSDPAATDPTMLPYTTTSGQTYAILFRNLNNQTKFYWFNQNSMAAAALPLP